MSCFYLDVCQNFRAGLFRNGTRNLDHDVRVAAVLVDLDRRHRHRRRRRQQRQNRLQHDRRKLHRRPCVWSHLSAHLLKVSGCILKLFHHSFCDFFDAVSSLVVKLESYLL